ncbi:transcriptional regulator [Pseudomonas amygdali pv. mori str. 301020]|uniref:Transcriptional regulator n=1 Tax=Pseudomonas amygdali pv. mori str. 301020 TaxID=629261 RepID=A0A656GG50_PSEA0|nr:transcriptional regulator [Pseudomonas amygdali pv. mori str. 301020]
MRIRTEAKRDAIVEIASQVFRESGFDGASMAVISARVGGSKRTLYGYFDSKEGLFGAVAQSAADTLFTPVFESLINSEESFPNALIKFGHAIVELGCDEQTLQIFRTIIGVSGRSIIGIQFYLSGPAKGLEILAGYLQSLIESGVLKNCDPAIAAQHLNALLQSETLLPSLLGALKPSTTEHLKQSAERAVRTFLDAYALQP